MATVNIYLIFNGNCETAFNFYKSVFGGEFTYLGKYREIPAQEGMPSLTESDKDRITHISLPISKETILMGFDNIKENETHTTFGNNFSVMVGAGSKEEADKLFNGLSVGGKVISPMKEEFWGDYFGALTDKFGINWMVGYELPQ